MRNLKDKPLVQGVIGNAIFQIIWSGASAMISFYTARSAYIQGLAFHWVVLIGAAIFFLLSAAWYFIDTRRRKQKIETVEESLKAEYQSKVESMESQYKSEKETLIAQHETASEDERTKHLTEIKTLKGVHRIDIESIRTEYKSEIEYLNSEHQQEIRGRDAAFDTLKRGNEILKEQNDGWNKLISQYSWLHNIASAQAKEIDHYVKLDRIMRGDVQLHDAVPNIRFGIYVYNDSVFDVAIELAKDGYIQFRDKKLLYPFDVIFDDLKKVKYQNKRCLTIEQRLTVEEAHFISSSEARDDAVFYFDRLVMTITGCNQYPRVTPKRLDMNKGVTLRGESVKMPR